MTSPSTKATFAEWVDEDDGAIYHPTGFNYVELELHAQFQKHVSSYRNVNEIRAKRVMFACVMPNLFFAAVPDGVLYYLLLPKGAKQLHYQVGFLPSDNIVTTFEATFPL